MAVIIMLVIIHFIPLIQDHLHWLKPVSIRFSMNKVEVNDDIGLYMPLAPDECVTLCLQNVTTLNYIPLSSAAALVDEGFTIYIC